MADDPITGTAQSDEGNDEGSGSSEEEQGQQGQEQQPPTAPVLPVEPPVPVEGQAPVEELRTDGPTLDEYVAAGYDAADYPPPGYAPRETSAFADLDALHSAKVRSIATALHAQLGHVHQLRTYLAEGKQVGMDNLNALFDRLHAIHQEIDAVARAHGK